MLHEYSGPPLGYIHSFSALVLLGWLVGRSVGRSVGILWWIHLYGKIRNEPMGLQRALHGQCAWWLNSTFARKFGIISFGFRKSPPHNDASHFACPVTAHITPDVEKVSS